MQRKTKAATQTGVYLAIVAVIVVIANVMAYSGLRTRFDVTRNQRFTLSQGSARLVQSLKSPMEVEAYVTRGLPKLDAFVRDLTDLFKLYQRAGGGKFHFTLIEAKTEEQRQAARDAGLHEVAFGEGSETGEDQASITQGFMGIVFKYGSEREAIPLLSPERSDGLEFWITNKIREVRDKADDVKHRIGVIVGKDEIKLTDNNLVPGGRQTPSMKSIIDQAFPFYTVEEVDLKGGDAEIDPELDGLLITQPDKDYTDKELRRIDQFLMRGNKSLVVVASAVNLKAGDAAMQATLSTHNLDKLLIGYGVEMKKDAVFDWQRSLRLPVMSMTGAVTWIRAPGILQVQHYPGLDDSGPVKQFLDDSFAAFFRADELAFPFPSTLVPHPDKQPNATVKPIARTTAAAWAETDDTVSQKIATTWQPKPPLEQRVIAVAVEGQLKASLGSGDDIEVPEQSAEPSRVLVISSSQFLANPFTRSGQGMDLGGQFAMMGPVGGDEQLQMMAQPYAQKYLTQTILALKNTFDWMSGDSDLIATSAKILGEPNLTYSDIARPTLDAEDDEASIKKKDEEYRAARKTTQQRVQWSLTLLCPALFAGIGLFRWRRRESGRLNISLD